MANSTIPGLVAVATPALTDLHNVRQSGDTRDKKATSQQLRDLLFSNTGLSANSIPYIDSSNAFAQNNSALYWDNVNEKLNVAGLIVTNNDAGNSNHIEINGTSTGLALLLNTGASGVAGGISFGDSDFGLFRTASVGVTLRSSGVDRWRYTSTTFQATSAGDPYLTSASPISYSFVADTAKGIINTGAGTVGMATNNVAAFDINTSQFVTFTKAINYNHISSSTDILTAGQQIIGIDDTSVARTVTLSNADTVKGRIIHVKDESGAAGTNNITIDTEGSATIDNVASVTITSNLGGLSFYCDGTDWFILG